MSLPLPEDLPVTGPRPDPVSRRIGKTPELLRKSLAELAGDICNRTSAPVDWPDVQVVAMQWATAAQEIARLQIQKQVDIQGFADSYHDGDALAAEFELVKSQSHRAIDLRVKSLLEELERCEVQLEVLSKRYTSRLHDCGSGD